MSSYHKSFTYCGKNSMTDYNLIITHFDNYDNGEVESYLTLDPVYRDSHRNMKRTLYGTKYSGVALLDITVIHADKSEFTIEQTRSINRWLTGSQQYTWMDFHLNDEPKYRMHCYIKDVRPYKMDSRIIGFIISVESSSPWCYSTPYKTTVTVEDVASFELECETDEINSYIPIRATFERVPKPPSVTTNGEYIEFTSVEFEYDEDSNELTPINASAIYDDESAYIFFVKPTDRDETVLVITNETIDNRETIVKNLSETEIIVMSENNMIQSDNPYRIFGGDFNYVWPVLKSGTNQIKVEGNGILTIEYILPIKASECVKEFEDSDYAYDCEI